MVIKVKKDGQYVKIPYLSTDVAVGEAPADGKQYARQDKAWSEVIIPDVDLTDVNAAIAANTAAIGTKVDKVTGKQLSTNDYTTAEKTKLTNIPTPDSIVTTNDNRLTVATPSKAGIMSAADKAQLDSTLTSTEIDSRLAAAVSSVYRVKGSKATFADLPTTDVAVGDVWNIEDTGANYVAINLDPVTWDKLSETIDLTPYMLTDTANSTFVKKDGSTPFSYLVTIEGTNDDDRFIRFQDVEGTHRGIVGKIGSSSQQGIWLQNEKTGSKITLQDNGKFEYNENTVWHSGNDGAGSGLDADLLDGLQASDFAKKSDNVVLTQAEYDALGDTVNSDGKIYFIKE